MLRRMPKGEHFGFLEHVLQTQLFLALSPANHTQSIVHR